MDNKPFCGVGKAPKGRKMGNMKECAELKQIRKYGEKKIDPRTLEGVKKKGAIKETRDELIKQVSGARGAINRFKGRVDELKKKQARKALTDEDMKKLKMNERELKKAQNILDKASAKLKNVLTPGKSKGNVKTVPKPKPKVVPKRTGAKRKAAK